MRVRKPRSEKKCPKPVEDIGMSDQHRAAITILVFHTASLCASISSLDTIFAAQAHSIPIPPAFDPPLIADLEHVVVREWFAGYMQSEEMRRLGLGRLAGEIKDRAVRRAEGKRDEEKKRGEEDLKMVIYTGHDT